MSSMCMSRRLALWGHTLLRMMSYSWIYYYDFLLLDFPVYLIIDFVPVSLLIRMILIKSGSMNFEIHG